MYDTPHTCMIRNKHKIELLSGVHCAQEANESCS